MKNTFRILVIVSFLALMGIKTYSQNLISITYGSKIDGTTISLFTNEAKVGYDSTTTALFSIGYFNDGFDVSAQAGLINDTASLATFLGGYNKIHATDFGNATAAGFFPAGSGSVEEIGVGKNMYLMSLGGITDWANASSATEIGLFRDTSWGTIPAGAQPIASDYAIESITYDTIDLGKEYLGEALTGAFTGFNGNIYASQAVGEVVPEPSTYALFLGVFSLGFVYWRKRLARKNAKE